jgi:hypothetical protein
LLLQYTYPNLLKKQHAQKGRLDPAIQHASHLRKPQLDFTVKPNNLDTSPWYPTLKHKYNARVPLGYDYHDDDEEYTSFAYFFSRTLPISNPITAPTILTNTKSHISTTLPTCTPPPTLNVRPPSPVHHSHTSPPPPHSHLCLPPSSMPRKSQSTWNIIPTALMQDLCASCKSVLAMVEIGLLIVWCRALER